MNPRIHEVTELRKEVLEALAKYTFCSRPQLYRIIPKRGEGKQETWERALRRALDLMERAGQITHGPVYEDAGNRKITRRWIHFLTKRGAEALGELNLKVPYYQRKPASLAHEEAITEFHLQLEQEIALLSAIHDIKERGPNPDPPQSRFNLHWLRHDIKRPGAPNPDAIFGIEDTTRPKGKSVLWFYLELELSRQGKWQGGKSQLHKKLENYDRYRQARGHQKDWKFIENFRVIVHVPTNERMDNLLKKFSTIVPYSFIWITSKETLNTLSPLQEAYLSPKDPQRSRSILDLIQ